MRSRVKINNNFPCSEANVSPAICSTKLANQSMKPIKLRIEKCIILLHYLAISFPLSNNPIHVPAQMITWELANQHISASKQEKICTPQKKCLIGSKEKTTKNDSGSWITGFGSFSLQTIWDRTEELTQGCQKHRASRCWPSTDCPPHAITLVAA